MATAPKPPAMPKPYNWNIYGGTLNTMKNLYNQYARTKFNYKPQQFKYAEFGGRDQYAGEAQKRVEADLAAQRIGTNKAIASTTDQYRLAEQAALAAQQEGNAAIQRQAEQDAGRMTNMLANSGISGQGGAEQMYGLRGVASQQIADNAVKYGLERAQAAAQRASEVGNLQAQQEMAQAMAASTAGDLTDQMTQAAFQNYMAQRGQAFGEFQDFAGRDYQAASDSYNSYLNALNNQLGVLGQMANLQGQTAQNIYQDRWNMYNSGYTRYQDIRDFLEGRSQFNRQMSAQQAADLRAYNQYAAQLAMQQKYNDQQYQLAIGGTQNAAYPEWAYSNPYTNATNTQRPW